VNRVKTVRVAGVISITWEPIQYRKAIHDCTLRRKAAATPLEDNKTLFELEEVNGFTSPV
jgi:hypothetical protein